MNRAPIHDQEDRARVTRHQSVEKPYEYRGGHLAGVEHRTHLSRAIFQLGLNEVGNVMDTCVSTLSWAVLRFLCSLLFMKFHVESADGD